MGGEGEEEGGEEREEGGNEMALKSSSK